MYLNLHLTLFADTQFNNAIAFAFIGDYSNIEPNEEAVKAFLDYLLYAEIDENKLIPEDYILIGQRDLISTQSPGNALYAILKTWNNWSLGWSFFLD